jgi:hypothetical protein
LLCSVCSKVCCDSLEFPRETGSAIRRYAQRERERECVSVLRYRHTEKQINSTRSLFFQDFHIKMFGRRHKKGERNQPQRVRAAGGVDNRARVPVGVAATRMGASDIQQPQNVNNTAAAGGAPLPGKNNFTQNTGYYNNNNGVRYQNGQVPQSDQRRAAGEVPTNNPNKTLPGMRNKRGNNYATRYFVCWLCTYPCHAPLCGGL